MDGNCSSIDVVADVGVWQKNQEGTVAADVVVAA